ncbi:MAG: aminotransferase class I/II-fold pyridoxal phosphate-dependent enzyme [Spirochaetes bacterium]|nr:aminotransferase class I/II-fold pyridoxal phosphate-dependent enzyme [Spirochaetota bacterium]
MDIRTRTAHAGLCSDEHTGAVSTPIYQSATFRHPGVGQSTGFDYSRTANPTRSVLEETLASLEGGDKAFAFSSGMAAITAVLSIFSKGDHIIVSDDLYGGTYRLFETVFKRFGITASYVDTSRPDAVLGAVTVNTKAVFIETPTNPMMKITDIRAIAGISHESNALLIVDNTFMTPYLQRPIHCGADIVVHSGTKYLGGHNDVLSGIIVCARKELSERIGFIQNATGGVLSPFDSWLLLRGIKTLAIRMDRAEENAQRVSDALLAHPLVTGVYYPGRLTSASDSTHRSQASGYGAMLSFRVKTRAIAERLIQKVRVISFAESLGGVESLITFPMVQTHADIPAAMREKIGITDTLLRLSVGIESSDDIIEDLKQALEQ